jgi:ketosteroid isomerase-like protein
MSGRKIVSLVALLTAGCATVQDVRPPTPTVPTPTCKGVADCDAKWSVARNYLIDHAAYKLENDSTDRLETFNPSNEATMGLRASVHREYEPDGSFAIVAKFWCNNLIVCSPDTKEALNDFNRAVAATTASESGMQSAVSPPPLIVAKASPPADIDASSDRAGNGTTRVDAESYIRESEAQWAESASQNDAAVVRRILADDCLWVVGSTVLDKAGAVSAAARGSADLVATHLDHAAVRLYGNAAVVQGSDTWTRKDGKSGHTVWTHTWIKRDGQWQIVAAQDMVEP